MNNTRSAIFARGIKAHMDFDESCLVTSSGLELHIEINGIYVDSLKLDSFPS